MYAKIHDSNPLNIKIYQIKRKCAGVDLYLGVMDSLSRVSICSSISIKLQGLKGHIIRSLNFDVIVLL